MITSTNHPGREGGGGGTRFRNNSMCRGKFTFQIRTLTVQFEMVEKGTLSAHFLMIYPTLIVLSLFFLITIWWATKKNWEKYSRQL